jgi:hypothetical protein
MAKPKEKVKIYQGFQVDTAMAPKGKDNMPADVYAVPHTMSGAPVSGELPAMSVETGREYQNRMNVSVANISKGNYPAEKTTGVKQRGAGCATKGFTSRGPLA